MHEGAAGCWDSVGGPYGTAVRAHCPRHPASELSIGARWEPEVDVSLSGHWHRESHCQPASECRADLTRTRLAAGLRLPDRLQTSGMLSGRVINLSDLALPDLDRDSDS